MLLFQKRFHAGLLDGSITLTFRSWEKPHVKPGGRYRCHPIGVLEVDAIERVAAGSISDDDARRAGFAGKSALFEDLAKFAKGPISPKTELFKVALHHGGDGDRSQLALEDALTDDDVATLAEKLRKLDERAEAPWVRKTLALIGKQPRVAASKLAETLRREKPELKADVVKLKKLGLTQSFEVGYEVSPRGRAFLARWKPKRR